MNIETKGGEPADERAAFVQWLSSTYPHSYDEDDAQHYWMHDHVTALAWQARAALATKPAESKACASVGVPVADWGNRDTKTAAGWINELLTLAEHRNAALPTWARSAVRTIAHGLHAALASPAPYVGEPECGICRGDPDLCDVHDCGDMHRRPATPPAAPAVTEGASEQPVAQGPFVVERCIRVGYRGGRRADGWNVKRDGKLIYWNKYKTEAQEKADELNAQEQRNAA